MAGIDDGVKVWIEDATVRTAIRYEDGDIEYHIECRMSNGEKYAPITVDAQHASLAMMIADLIKGQSFTITLDMK